MRPMHLFAAALLALSTALPANGAGFMRTLHPFDRCTVRQRTEYEVGLVELRVFGSDEREFFARVRNSYFFWL